MNSDYNLLHHVGVVAKKLREAAVAETAAATHKRDENTSSGTILPRGKKAIANMFNNFFHIVFRTLSTKNLYTFTFRSDFIL